MICHLHMLFEAQKPTILKVPDCVTANRPFQRLSLDGIAWTIHHPVQCQIIAEIAGALLQRPFRSPT